MGNYIIYYFLNNNTKNMTKVPQQLPENTRCERL